MTNPENNENNPETSSRFPEVDFTNPRKDPESLPPAYEQGDNDGAHEIQMGQYDSGSESKQYE